MIGTATSTQNTANSGHAVDRTGSESERILVGVLEAAESLGESVNGSVGSSHQSDYQALMKVLAYCYAHGIYASTEIEAALSADPILLYLTEGRRHDSTEFRRFRRRNAVAVQRCLARTLEKSWSKGTPVPAADRGSPGAYARSAMERWRTLVPRPDFESEAAARVRKAICDDAALLDE